MLRMFDRSCGTGILPVANNASIEPENMPNKSNFNEFHADSEHKSFTKVESTKLAEEIRNLKQAYHLERRLFM